MSANFITIGTLIKPLSETFGWSRTQIGSFGLIFVACQILFGPFVGVLVGRYGVRRIALTGAVALPLANVAAAFASSSISSWFLASAVISLAALPLTPAIWSTAIVSHFHVQRGLALGMAFSGVGLSNATVPLFAYVLADTLGWRAIYFGLAAVMGAVVLPIIWIYFKDPVSAAARKPEAPRADLEPALPGLTLGEALRTRRFWSLCLGLFVTTGIVGALNVHMQPMFGAQGVAPLAAAGLATIYGPAQIFARVVGGYLLDRVRGPSLGAAAAALPLLSCGLLLAYPRGAEFMVLAPIGAGLAAGLELDVLAYYVSRYFGQRAFPAICGIAVSLAYSAGLGIGPVLASAAYDFWGEYRQALMIMVLSLPVGALLIFSLGPFPTSPVPTGFRRTVNLKNYEKE